MGLSFISYHYQLRGLMSRSLGLNEKFTKRELQDLPGGQWYITRCSQCREFDLVRELRSCMVHGAWFSQKNEIEPQLSRTSGCRLLSCCCSVLHCLLEFLQDPLSTCVLSRFNHVWLCATLWTVLCQAPLSMVSPGKNTGVCCLYLLQGILPTQGSNTFLTSPALAGVFFTSRATWEASEIRLLSLENPTDGGLLSRSQL